MGYYSEFKLETVPNLENTVIFYNVIKAFRNLPYFSPDRDFDQFERFVAGTGRLSEITWYDCAEHLQGISEQFPEIAFAIHRVGEGTGEDAEIEAIYAKNGKVERVLRKPDYSRPEPESSVFRKSFGYPPLTDQ